VDSPQQPQAKRAPSRSTRGGDSRAGITESLRSGTVENVQITPPDWSPRFEQHDEHARAIGHTKRRLIRESVAILTTRARGGTRTLTPRRAGGFKPPTSASYATRAGAATVGDSGQAAADSGPAAPSPPTPAPIPTAASSEARTRRAPSPVRPLETRTPSTMSTATSFGGRARMRTATTGPPGSRRIVRGTPERRGGVRNAGTTRPAARDAAPMRRASSANRIGGAVSISRIEYAW
jgi:hypothetical protein